MIRPLILHYFPIHKDAAVYHKRYLNLSTDRKSFPWMIYVSTWGEWRIDLDISSAIGGNWNEQICTSKFLTWDFEAPKILLICELWMDAFISFLSKLSQTNRFRREFKKEKNSIIFLLYHKIKWKDVWNLALISFSIS